MDEAPAAIVWYKSAVVRRLAYSIAVQLLGATHLSHYITGDGLQIMVDDLLEVGGMAYAAWAIHARATKPMPVLTTSQAKADVANILPEVKKTP